MKRTFNFRRITYSSHILSYAVGVLLVLGVISSTWAKAPKTAKIVFTSTQDGGNQIYTMNPDGSDQMNLSRNDVWDTEPVWSPDGKQILFVSDRDGLSDLYVMGADGRGVRKVFGDSEYRTNPTWSPDGKQIAYAQGEEPNRAIYIATINGGSAQKLTDGFMPSWSPDGDEIVFVVGGVRHARLSIFSLRTRTTKTLLQNEMPWVVYPSWSPRGDKIAFSKINGSFQQGFLSWSRAQLYTVNRDGTELQQITKDEKAVAMEPTWSPHNGELIYSDVVRRPAPWTMQLFRTDMSNRGPVQLTDADIGHNYDADWFDPTALDVSPSEQLLTTVWGKIKVD